jgi:acetolactate synthase-1/2/3 large subunit
MGHDRVVRALRGADAVLLVGTQLPLLARLGVEAVLHEKRVAGLSCERPFVGTWNQWSASISLASELDALVRTAARLRPAAAPLNRVRGIPASAVSPAVADERLTLRSAMEIVNSHLPDGGVVLADAGNTGAGAAHYVRCPTSGRWLMAMGMAGMGYTFGAAIGAAKASGQRCFVLSGDGAFFMHGLEVHTAVQHALPITYVILDNRAHGMCLVRERLLLDDNAGYNNFARANVAAGLGAMFPTLPARNARTRGELERAFEDFATVPGPAVVSAELDDVEIPPFAAFAEALQRGVDKVSRSGAP